MLEENITFYMICPKGVQTGGTELAHQLVDYLNNNNKICYMVYCENGKFVNADIPDGFKNYNILLKDTITDDNQSYIVIPETFLYFSKLFQKSKMVFWWMSFDNYFSNADLNTYYKFYNKGLLSLRQLASKIKNYDSNAIISFSEIKKIDESRILHAYQSKYVSDMLHSLGIHKQLPLSDFINLDFLKNKSAGLPSNRKNIILYNPAKGYKITQKLIDLMPNIDFIPLKGLKRFEMMELFQRAKVYIDFGNHPGKDRIPREACINDCCVITGKNGSAKYFEDVPIPEIYKFDDDELENVRKLILDIFENYEKHIKNFVYYKSKILDEQKIFYAEIDDLVSFLESSSKIV